MKTYVKLCVHIIAVPDNLEKNKKCFFDKKGSMVDNLRVFFGLYCDTLLYVHRLFIAFAGLQSPNSIDLKT